jgi:hypothetical protein
MSQPAKQGNETGSSGFFRTITALASSENDDQQTQDSTSVEETEPANDEESEEEFSEQEQTDEEGTEESEQDETEQPESDPDDPEKKRFKYWQSKHDKVSAELNKAKSELESFKTVPKEAVDIAKAILEDANAVAVLEEYLKTGRNPLKAQPSGPSAIEQMKSLQRPTEPTKPEDYDEDDAITDPKSESAKYLRAERQYEKDLRNYLLKREELRDKAEEEKTQVRLEAERRREYDQKLRRELTTKHGIAAGELDEFFQVVTAQPTNEDMVLFYKAKKGLLKQVAQVTQKKQELEKKAELAKKNPPAPGTKTGGSAGNQPNNSFFISRK